MKLDLLLLLFTSEEALEQSPWKQFPWYIHAQRDKAQETLRFKLVWKTWRWSSTPPLQIKTFCSAAGNAVSRQPLPGSHSKVYISCREPPYPFLGDLVNLVSKWQGSTKTASFQLHVRRSGRHASLQSSLPVGFESSVEPTLQFNFPSAQFGSLRLPFIDVDSVKLKLRFSVCF